MYTYIEMLHYNAVLLVENATKFFALVYAVHVWRHFLHTGSGIQVQVEVLRAHHKRKCTLTLKCCIRMPCYWWKTRRNFSHWFKPCKFGAIFRHTGSGIKVQVEVVWAPHKRKCTPTLKCCIKMRTYLMQNATQFFPIDLGCARLAAISANRKWNWITD